MTRYEIETDSIRWNVREVKARAGVPVWAVVKFDGYAMGLELMAGLLSSCGIDRFAVSEPRDAFALRTAGFSQKLLLLRPLASDEEIRQMISCGVILSADSTAYLERVAAQASALGAVARIHLAIDTGLGRYGFLPEEYEEIKSAYLRENLAAEGIFSHFSSAFRSEEVTRRQYAAFTALLDRLAADGVRRGEAHICNSAALYCCDGMRLDAVRVGSAFLGRVAARSDAAKRLKRVGILKSEVTAVRTLRAGSCVGYGGGVALSRDTDTAVVPFGLCDGLNPGIVFASVKTGAARFQAPLLGPPAAGHVILDVTGAGVRVGDEVSVDFNPLYLNPHVAKVYL